MEEKILNGLRELSKTTFPRKCTTCGRVYDSFEEFVSETRPLEGRSGLQENIGCPEEGDNPIVEIYRNCVCGSTLMEFALNRRDTSEHGLRRREIFNKLLNLLVERGLSGEDAKKELRLLLQSRKSQLLENMGIQLEYK
ncbi:MAG: oxidoreductase [Candidatus Thiodiazotropha sp.]|jgi:hypothetical protein